jgi:hypothetical protein
VGETGAVAVMTAKMAASRGLRREVFINILTFGLEKHVQRTMRVFKLL